MVLWYLFKKHSDLSDQDIDRYWWQIQRFKDAMFGMSIAIALGIFSSKLVLFVYAVSLLIFIFSVHDYKRLEGDEN